MCAGGGSVRSFVIPCLYALSSYLVVVVVVVDVVDVVDVVVEVVVSVTHKKCVSFCTRKSPPLHWHTDSVVQVSTLESMTLRAIAFGASVRPAAAQSRIQRELQVSKVRPSRLTYCREWRASAC